MSILTIKVLAKQATAPSVNAGIDQEIQLPISSVQLVGQAEPNGEIASVQWTQVSGPSKTIINSNSLNASVNSLSEATYVFRLTATNTEGVQGSDDITIQVLPQQTNQPPTASNLSIQYTYNNTIPSTAIVLSLANLSSTYSDPEGTTPSKIEIVSLPLLGDLFNSNTNQELVSGDQFTVSDLNNQYLRFRPSGFDQSQNNGSFSTSFTMRIFDGGNPSEASSTITVTLVGVATGNQAPTIQLQEADLAGNANGNDSISTRSSTNALIFVKAVASDPENDPLSYSWSFVSGNISGDTISPRTDTSIANITLSNSSVGNRTVVVRCTVNDGVNTVTDDISIDLTVSLSPTNTITGDTIVNVTNPSGNGTLNINKSGGGVLQMNVFGGSSNAVEDTVLTISIAGVGTYSVTAIPNTSDSLTIPLPTGTFTYSLSLTGFTPSGASGSITLIS